MERLIRTIRQLDRKPFGAVQRLRGTYRYPSFTLTFRHIQGSPGAHPASIAEIALGREACAFPDRFLDDPTARRGLEDFLIRRFHRGIEALSVPNRGADGSGSLHTVDLSQIIVARDTVEVTEGGIVLRFMVSFPSRVGGGGSFDADQAVAMVAEEIPTIARFTFAYGDYEAEAVRQLEATVSVLEDRAAIAAAMRRHGWIVFVPDGAILPRRSGVDPRPMASDEAVPFSSPETLRVSVEVPSGSLTGMALPEGVTVITGGGFHGKSTLLQAITEGVYPHVPGDGRERVVTRADGVMLRSEEGRSVRRVDIHPFIRELPGGRETDRFSTDDASGSTSQAAAIVEAIEAGSRLLLLDEDSCATNLLVRDDLIARIIPSEREPIRPLYETVRSLWHTHGISTVLVAGGLGLFLRRADTVLLLEAYRCRDVTDRVRETIGWDDGSGAESFALPVPRRLLPGNFDPSFTNRRLAKTVPVRIKPLRQARRKLEYGMDLVDLSDVVQLIEAPQTLALGWMIHAMYRQLEVADTPLSLVNLLDALEALIDREGLAALKHPYPGTLSRPRRYELASAVNRMRSLRVE